MTITTPGTYLFTFSIVLQSTTNPTSAYIIPVNVGTTIGNSVINTQNLSISGSFVIANTSGAQNLQLNYGGGTGVTINPASYYQAVRIA